MRSAGRARLRQGEKFLTVIQIIDAFAFYGADVILLAFVTALTVQICKATFLKKINKKLFTFLPFTFGTLFYAVYAAVRNLSFIYLVNEYISIIEHGISVGAAATLLYVLYEQFVREKNGGLSAAEGVISALIEGYVPCERVDSVAKLISEAIQKDVTGAGAKKAEDILKQYSYENMTETDSKMLANLIIETLAHVNAA